MSWASGDLVSKRSLRAFLALVAFLYLALATGSVLTERPLSDEAWLASPALNLLSGGFMGTSVLEPANPEFQGIDRRTYWVMPLHILGQALWYKVFGFGLIPLRLLSVAWGLVALGSWFLIVKRLAGSERAALITVLLLGVDHIFVWASALGRMDMMSAALGSAAIAAYLASRARRFGLALLAGHGLAAAASLTHPNGLLFSAGLVFIALHLDRERLTLRRLVLPATPYVLAAAAWGLYALQDPAAFRSQLAANLFGYGVETGPLLSSPRLVALNAPWKAVELEVTERYLPAYGLAPEGGGPGRAKLLILLAYGAGVLGGLMTKEIRGDRGCRSLGLLALLFAVLLALFGFPKSKFYLVYLVPLFAASTAVWSAWLWRRRPVLRWPLALAALAVIGVQTAAIGQAILRDGYRTRYATALGAVRALAGPVGFVMGPSEFAFGCGFDGRIRDDLWFGYHSGRKPAVIVVYEQGFEVYMANRHDLRRYVTELLAREFRLAYRNATYRVYARLDERQPPG